MSEVFSELLQKVLNISTSRQLSSFDFCSIASLIGFVLTFLRMVQPAHINPVDALHDI